MLDESLAIAARVGHAMPLVFVRQAACHGRGDLFREIRRFSRDKIRRFHYERAFVYGRYIFHGQSFFFFSRHLPREHFL